MKALTIHQPWAELIACGKKRIETRSWNTWYRGPLAIHASKNRHPEAFKMLDVRKKSQIWNYFVDKVPSGNTKDVLDYGAIIAVCRIIDCLFVSPYYTRANPHRQAYWQAKDVVEDERGIVINNKLVASVRIPPVEPELSYGDYTPGRYAWILTDVQRLPRPVPVRGRQRLWEVDDQLILEENQIIAHWMIDEFINEGDEKNV
jgi:activating signal cointegrator 1